MGLVCLLIRAITASMHDSFENNDVTAWTEEDTSRKHLRNYVGYMYSKQLSEFKPCKSSIYKYTLNPD